MNQKDAVFRDAMRAAVAERGADYRYPTQEERPEFYARGASMMPHAVYSTEGGEAACLVGLALALAGDAVPGATVNCKASTVLTTWGYGQTVAVAARIAQIHQDFRGEWGECLSIFEAVINNVDHMGPLVLMSPESDFYAEMCRRVGVACLFKPSHGMVTVSAPVIEACEKIEMTPPASSITFDGHSVGGYTEAAQYVACNYTQVGFGTVVQPLVGEQKVLVGA